MLQFSLGNCTARYSGCIPLTNSKSYYISVNNYYEHNSILRVKVAKLHLPTTITVTRATPSQAPLTVHNTSKYTAKVYQNTNINTQTIVNPGCTKMYYYYY